MKSGESRNRPGGPKNKRNTANDIDNQSNSASHAKQKYSQTFAQIRPVMSAFFCTAQSRPSLGRRLRRRLKTASSNRAQ